PDDITIDSVSVDINTGEIYVGWPASTAKDLYGYVVWQSAGTNNIPIDTVFSTQYIDLPFNGVKGYALTALDSCFNQSVINTVHSTMFLSSSFDTCRRLIELSWTPYVGWNIIGEYRVYYRINNGSYSSATAG